MSWTLLLTLVLALGIALFASISRRMEIARMEESVRERDRAVRAGSAKAQLQHPVIDLSRCLGCATCVASCPEDGVLELVHGQAAVVNGARCMGISACERECPVGAITVTLTNLEERTDIPAVNDELEAIGSSGLFLAGEVTAHALIKTAIDHGTAVGAEVARRVQERGARNGNGNGGTDDVLDLCIVGAGPAGIACSLEAKRHGLHFLTIEQEEGAGGTVAKYPRRKLVLMEPVNLPLGGRLSREYEKEELMDLWQGIVDEHQLPIRGGQTFEHVEHLDDGNFVVHTKTDTFTARNVCLALGRRGSPKKLGIPGEDLPKVAYSLMDAQSYQGRRVLVVGGGDSAVEAAMGLAEQPGNHVTLSYRGDTFFRIRGKNEQRLQQCLAENKLHLLLQSEVRAIHPEVVELTVQNGQGPVPATLPNDEVFVMAGGTPPLTLLEQSGVSFDPSLRKTTTPIVEQGPELTRALGAGFLLSAIALIWAGWHLDYYTLPLEERAAHPKHDLLGPSKGIGLWLGVAAAAMIVANLLYLIRRSPKFRFSFGSLKWWMTSHIATGILAFLCAMLHGAMAPRDTQGGHAFWALAFLVVTGAIGRYFYAWMPHAANGRELELDEAKARLGKISEDWNPAQREFSELARSRVFELMHARQWKSSFLGRVLSLLGVRRGLRRTLKGLADEGLAQGIPEDQVKDTLRLARQAHRTALMVSHYEDLRGVLNTWRYLHRWVAALMVLLVIIHVVYALTYGILSFGGGSA